MKNKIIVSFLERNAQLNPDAVSIRVKKDEGWKNFSWAEYYKLAQYVGEGLKALGQNKGDRVAILSNSRFEWAYSDMGILGAGLVTVPIYHNTLPEDLIHILNDSEAKTLICENRFLLSKWLEIKSKCKGIEQVITIDDYQNRPAEILSWNEFLSKGRSYGESHPDFFNESLNKTGLSDNATIIYTSGTTGKPKGVLLTHQQIISEIEDVFNVINILPTDVSLSFLPYAHVMGRVECWGQVYRGFQMAFAESIEQIKHNLIEIQPTLLIAVPRIFEKIFNGVLAQVETSKVRQHIFRWAHKVGSEVSRCKLNRKPIPLKTLAEYLVAKRLVFNPLLEKMGGRLRFAISGGAPLSQEIAEFFHAAGLLILEGYGLTETTAAVCLNTPYDYAFGTVGKPLADVEIKLAEDGEIFVKSKKVMKEYYNDPEATAKVMHEGFFATGDIGEWTAAGHLKITDRKKDLIKTAGGKYVAPQRLTGLLLNNPYISQVHVHGDKKKYIVALVTLDFQSIKQFAEHESIRYQNMEELTKHPKVQQLVRSLVAEANSQLASFETIKNFAVLPHEFTVESGELTPSLKVKRKFCDQKYADIIEGLYG